MQPNLSSGSIFVDDDDPAIVYEGPWVTRTGLPSTGFEVAFIPLYGTLHTNAGLPLGSQFKFQYKFNGEPSSNYTTITTWVTVYDLILCRNCVRGPFHRWLRGINITMQNR